MSAHWKLSVPTKSVASSRITQVPPSSAHNIREEMCSHTISVDAPQPSSNVSVTQIRPCSIPSPSNETNSTTIPQEPPTYPNADYPYLWILGPGIFVLLLILYGLLNFKRDMRVYMYARRNCNARYRNQDGIMNYVMYDLEGQLPTVDEEDEDIIVHDVRQGIGSLAGSSSTIPSWTQIFITSSQSILPRDRAPPGSWSNYQPPNVRTENNSPDSHGRKT